MIKVRDDRVAVIPVFDSEVSRGGIIKPSYEDYIREVPRFDIYGSLNWDRDPKKLDEVDSVIEAREKVQYYTHKGYIHTHYKKVKVKVEAERLDVGERCDQGVVKYVGKNVKTVKIGDYVFFSGYSGTLMDIEGEGKLILLPEKFIVCVFDIDKFYPVPGLYFKNKHGEYFQATYEQAMSIMAESFTNHNLTVEVKPEKLSIGEYEEDG